MLPTYRVRVVARYAPGVQVTHRLHASQNLPETGAEWDTSAVHWTTSDACAVDAKFAQTLTLVYDAEGRNAAEAALFARAIFECERKRAALPVPVMLAVFPE